MVLNLLFLFNGFVLSKAVYELRRALKSVATNREVAAALDRVNLPDRGAMFVIASVIQALSHPLQDLALSRSTIRSSRVATRQQLSKSEFALFMNHQSNLWTLLA